MIKRLLATCCDQQIEPVSIPQGIVTEHFATGRKELEG